MVARKNEIGKRYGTLTVMQDAGNNEEGRSLWLCRCDCGEERIVKGKDLGKRVTGCRSRCKIAEDLSGRTFGFLKVLKRVESDKHGFARFLCRCINLVESSDPEGVSQMIECACELEVNAVALRTSLKNSSRKVPKSCFDCSRKLYGELKSKENFIDLSGQTFGRLTAFRRVSQKENRQKRIVYECSCSCGSGKISLVRQEALIGKSVRPIRSCGCLQREHARRNKSNFIHGMTKHPLHIMWCGMRIRCNQPENPAYKWYGGRGIKVCDKWMEFSSFYDWAISKGWKKGLTIDRIDNKGPYSPENCQFLTRAENALKMQSDRGKGFVVGDHLVNIHRLSQNSQVSATLCRKLLSNGYSEEDVFKYGQLQLHQKNVVSRSIHLGNPIPMGEASKRERIAPLHPPQSSEMGSYRAMMARCYNVKTSSYRNYGGKGIKVCPEWKDNPAQFLLDMGPKPSPGDALDRIDSSKGYSPNNCRWLSVRENSRRVSRS